MHTYARFAPKRIPKPFAILVEMSNLNRQRGFIGIIAILVILFLIAGALKINLRGYIDASPEQALNSNVVLVIQTGKVIYADYIKAPFVTLWDKYILPFVHGDFLSKIREREQAQTTLPPQ